jgi:peptidoglycan-associated lipoprotein
MSRVTLVTVASILGALAAGCGAEPPPPPQVAAIAPPTRSDAIPVGKAQGQDTRSPMSSSVHIDERILKACGGLPTAHFAFDSSAVDPGAAMALDALARCFTSGPLQGRGMRLVGHADSRGEIEYNLALGQRRAGNVAGYLAQRGMPAARMQSTSRGEFEARGTDEVGWAKDRKVDVILAE